MSREARQVLDELLTARDERSVERIGQALRDDARYWDTEQGEVTGRNAVTQALIARDARLEVETVAASEDHAVLELQVHESGGTYRRTEVYRVQSGAVASISSYFDPAARGT